MSINTVLGARLLRRSDDRGEAFMQATGNEVRTRGHAAYYRPSEDIQMPDAGLFTGSDTSSATEAMYSTLLHDARHRAPVEPRPRLLPATQSRGGLQGGAARLSWAPLFFAPTCK